MEKFTFDLYSSNYIDYKDNTTPSCQHAIFTVKSKNRHEAFKKINQELLKNNGYFFDEEDGITFLVNVIELR